MGRNYEDLFVKGHGGEGEEVEGSGVGWVSNKQISKMIH